MGLNLHALGEQSSMRRCPHHGQEVRGRPHVVAAVGADALQSELDHRAVRPRVGAHLAGGQTAGSLTKPPRSSATLNRRPSPAVATRGGRAARTQPWRREQRPRHCPPKRAAPLVIVPHEHSARLRPDLRGASGCR
eukprot:4442445-Pyramimonas_sp.AAC.1